MLLFIDQPKHIRVVRGVSDESGHMTRVRLGLVAKATLEPTAELEDALVEEEKAELASALDMYRERQVVAKHAAALSFPETMRLVTEYLQDGATESERKIIVSALMEGVRLLRKAAKEEAEQTPS